jgi:hypothetical protein
MTTVVTAVFPDLPTAEAAVGRLVAAGFQRKAVSVIAASTPEHEHLVKEETDDVHRGIVTGALTGGVLSTLTFGAMTLSGIGVLIAGPLFMSLTAGAAGTVVGGIVGALTGYGTSSMMAQGYESAIQNGHILIAVHTTYDHRTLASTTLQQSGGQDLSASVHPKHGASDDS